MGIINVDRIEEQAREVEQDSGWKRLDGRYHGVESGVELKIHVGVGGGTWDEEVQQANVRIASKLSPKERAEYQWAAANLATQDNKKLATAYRVAMERTKCLITVAWAGPNFENRTDFDDWLDDQAEVLLQGSPVKVPENALEIFKATKEGKIQLPTQTQPPDNWICTKDDIFKLKNRWEFVSAVALFRNQLESAKLVSEEDDLGNLVSSGDSPPPGKRSTKTPEPPSKDT